MGSTDAQICFEGPLVKVTKGRNTQNLWCTLDNECMAFYRNNKRSSCMFRIEINKVKSVTPLLDKNQFEVVAERSFLFSAETVELCKEWIDHIEEARQQDGTLVITSQKQNKPPTSPRRGSLPQQNTVSNALKRLSSDKSDTSSSESSSHTKPMETIERQSSTKNMINRFSGGLTQKEQPVSSPSRPSPRNSGSKVGSLLLHFCSDESGCPSPSSPLSPTSRPPKPAYRPMSSAMPEKPSSNMPARPLSTSVKPSQQKETGITSTSSGTKIDLSEVSSVTNVSSRSQNTDSGYGSVICSSPPKESPQNHMDLPTVNGADACKYEDSSHDVEEKVVLRVKSIHTDGSDDVVMRRGTKKEDSVDKDEDVDEEEEDEDEAAPNLQLLDELMGLTFEEIEIPQSSPVDMSSLTELKGLMTDLPPSLLLRRSIDVNNQGPVEDLRQFLKAAQ